jgi:hypothetical protein
MTEYDHEPVRGLPGDLPHGERIIWQASPDWRAFRRDALFTRWLAVYFGGLALLSLAGGNLFGAAAIVVAGMILQGLLTLFAVLVARTTIYTLTNRRVVLRVGVALNKCINLPLGLIGSADLRKGADGHGDIALSLIGRHRLGYAMLWPHARPFRLSRPQPMLRALADAPKLAEALARACAAVAPNEAALSPATSGPAIEGALQGVAA